MYDYGNGDGYKAVRGVPDLRSMVTSTINISATKISDSHQIIPPTLFIPEIVIINTFICDRCNGCPE